MPSNQYNTLTVNRTPPAAVRRELRREVGFGCPVPDCGNPYLYWHHFRSKALIPVRLGPLRSTETPNAVPWSAVFSTTIIGILSSLKRSEVSETQISPR